VRGDCCANLRAQAGSATGDVAVVKRVSFPLNYRPRTAIGPFFARREEKQILRGALQKLDAELSWNQ